MNEKIENIVNSLSSEEKDELYRRLWLDYIKSDIVSFCAENNIDSNDKLIADAAKAYVYGCNYDCNLDYWTNIKNVLETAKSSERGAANEI